MLQSLISMSNSEISGKSFAAYLHNLCKVFFRKKRKRKMCKASFKVKNFQLSPIIRQYRDGHRDFQSNFCLFVFCLFVFLVACFSLCLFVYWPVCLDLFCVCLFVSLRMTVFPFVYLSFYLPVSVFTCVSVFLSCLSFFLSFCLFFSFCPSDYLSRKSCHVPG